MIGRVLRALRPAPAAPRAAEITPAEKWFVGFEGQYPDWQSAADAIGVQQDEVYDFQNDFSPDLSAWNGSISSNDLGLSTALLSAMLDLRKDSVSVLDFGGALGTHFLLTMKLGLTTRLRWTVVELSHVAQIGAQKWGEREGLRFVDSIAAVPKPVDIVVASGSLQLVPQSLSALEGLLALAPRYLVIDRMPMSHRNAHFVTIEKVGPGFYGVERRFPSWVFSRSALLQIVAPAYEPQFFFDDDVDPKQPEFRFQGLLLRRKPA